MLVGAGRLHNPTVIPPSFYTRVVDPKPSPPEHALRPAHIAPHDSFVPGTPSRSEAYESHAGLGGGRILGGSSSDHRPLPVGRVGLTHYWGSVLFRQTSRGWSSSASLGRAPR